jgi:hypothetical protein
MNPMGNFVDDVFAGVLAYYILKEFGREIESVVIQNIIDDFVVNGALFFSLHDARKRRCLGTVQKYILAL